MCTRGESIAESSWKSNAMDEKGLVPPEKGDFDAWFEEQKVPS